MYIYGLLFLRKHSPQCEKHKAVESKQVTTDPTALNLFNVLPVTANSFPFSNLVTSSSPVQPSRSNACEMRTKGHL